MIPQGTPEGVASYSGDLVAALERPYDYRDVAAIPAAVPCDTPGVPSKARMIREALGISVRQLARDLAYDHGYLSKVENGKRGWSLYGALAWMDYMTLRVAKARRDGFQIPDSAIPTLRELALVRPDRRTAAPQSGKPKRKKRAKKVPRKAGKGGNHGQRTRRAGARQKDR